jgi:hypothetical protein
MVFKVVDKVLLSVLAQEIVFYLRGVRGPFEVEECDSVRYFLPPDALVHNSRYDRVVVAFQQDIPIALRVHFLSSHLGIFLLNFLLLVQLLKLIPFMHCHWLTCITQMLGLVWLRILVSLYSTLIRVLSLLHVRPSFIILFTVVEPFE